MDRDQLAARHTAAITRWFVTMRDTAKVPPQLLDDLAGIADEHAAGLAAAPVPLQPPGSGFSVAADPGRLAAGGGGGVGIAPAVHQGGNGKPDPGAPAAGGGAGETGSQGAAVTPGGSGSARSRARARGGPK